MAEIVQSTFERCCRLCAEEQDVTIMIFSDEAEAICLQKKLHKYLFVEVKENDKLPKNICIKCCTKLQTVCEFIERAHKAQEILIQHSLKLDVMNMNKNDEEQNSDHEDIDNQDMATTIEINVDPMVVLQNSEEELPQQPVEKNVSVQDVTHLHDVDGENVTIKLIKNGDSKSSDNSESTTKGKPFPCKTCKRGFFTELALKNHSWIHITEKTEGHNNDDICSESGDYNGDLIAHFKQFKITNGLCQWCGRMFRSERTYKDHMSVHASTATSFTCKICGRSYKTWGSLRYHSITHSSERPYTCHFCKKSFKRKQDLKFHINQHTGARPYKCPFCEKCFASSGNCYSHRNRMHPGKCFDGKVTRWSGQPKENQIEQSSLISKGDLTNVGGIYKYQCKLCEHSFFRRDNYTYHMYQHTGEKPYQCSFCSDKFVTRKGLLIHHDKEHSPEDRPSALLTKNMLLK